MESSVETTFLVQVSTLRKKGFVMIRGDDSEFSFNLRQPLLKARFFNATALNVFLLEVVA
jgi:hypothetical protein